MTPPVPLTSPGPAPHRIGVCLLGSSFVLETSDTATLDAVHRLWRAFLDSEQDPAAHVIDVDSQASTTPDRLLAFATAVNASALDAASEFAVHAGVVEHAGVAVAMPAVSGTGKSTMTAACLRRGFRYLSDEALCLRYTDGAVVAYPRPIALSPWSVDAVGARDGGETGIPSGDEILFTADELGAAHATTARLGHIVLLDRLPGARPTLTPEPRPVGVTLLLQQSFNHYRRPADAVRLVADVVSKAQVWTLRYSDPLAAADLLRVSLGQADDETSGRVQDV